MGVPFEQSADADLAVVDTPIISKFELSGRAFLYVRNNGLALISVSVWEYPDGITAVKNVGMSNDLADIDPGAMRISWFNDHTPTVSVSGAANSGVQSVHAEITRPPVKAARQRLGS